MARILLIDDDDLLREIVVEALTSAGHLVTEARGGRLGATRQLAKPFSSTLLLGTVE